MNFYLLVEFLQNPLVLTSLLITLGLVGISFLRPKTLLSVFIAMEVMLLGLILGFLMVGNIHKSYQGIMIAITILAIAAAEAMVGLGLFVALYQKKKAITFEDLDRPESDEEQLIEYWKKSIEQFKKY